VAIRTRRVLFTSLVVFLELGAGFVAADSAAPTSLQMRSHRTVNADQARRAQQRRPLRLAQTPDPNQPQPPPDPNAPPPPDPNAPPPTPAPTEPTPPVPAPVEPAPPPPTPAVEPAPAPVAQTPSHTDEELAKLSEEAAEGEVIEVTGSLIERKELNTAAPVTVLDKADLDAAGVTSVGDILQNLPAQTNGINVQFNNGGDGSTTVNLRGLGSNRTLLLLNGRRVVPGGTGVGAAVDLSAIPLGIIERVEVLKDGASAIYGSDAIGGVVNIITKDQFDGAIASAYSGVTQRGDALNYEVNLTTGVKGKKSSLMFSATYNTRGEVMAGDRAFSKSDLEYDYATKEQFGAGSGTTPEGSVNAAGAGRQIGTDAWRDFLRQCPGAIAGRGNCFRDPKTGLWRPFATGGNSDLGEGDLYNFQPENYLVTPEDRYSLWTSGKYQFEPRVGAFFEALYTNRTSDQNLAAMPVGIAASGITYSRQSVYNPFGTDLTSVNRRIVEAGRRVFAQDIDTFRMVGGLQGKIPQLNGWKWEASYNYGRTNAKFTNAGQFNVTKLTRALGPSFRDADGKAVCGTAAAPITADGCVPLDLLSGPGTITKEMLDYISYTGISESFIDQRTLLATASGQLAKTPWGGDLSLAIGADYRVEAAADIPDPVTAAGDTTGNSRKQTEGEYNVKEAFAELSFVPLTNREFAKWLELSAAARVFQYDTFGTGATWKLGGLYTIPQGYSLRGTFSSAFRAPDINSLYAGQGDNFPTIEDPCETRPTPEVAARCQELHPGIPGNYDFPFNQSPSLIGGNPTLQEETAKVFTAGIVAEPPQVKGLTATLDYFHVDIEDAIQALGVQVILNACYVYNIDSECAKIEREAGSFFLSDVRDLQENIGGTTSSGLDFAVAYDRQYNFGRLRHSFEGTWLLDYTAHYPGFDIKGMGNYDVAAFPELKANVATVWAHKGLSAGVNVRYVNAFKECENGDCGTDEGDPEDPMDDVVPLSRKIDTNITADLFFGYTTKSKAGTTSLTVGLNNLTDQDPPLIYSGSLGNSDAATYDYLGRYFYTRLTHNF
jgi:iron complex outermembrane recepter protein